MLLFPKVPVDAPASTSSSSTASTDGPRRGEITVRADVTADIKAGVVWTVPHFAAASANRLTNDVLDERVKIPEYKAAAEVEVTVEPAGDDAAADD